MLQKLSEKDFDKYIDYVYSLATDITKSSYPTFCDGIKTKKDFIAFSKNSFNKKNEEILLFIKDEKVLGWIHYYFIPKDKYLTIFSFQVESDFETAMAEFLSFCVNKFPSYELWMGFSDKNTQAVNYLSNNGFTLIESSYNDVFDFSNYVCEIDPLNVTELTKDEFQQFSKLLGDSRDDAYWTAEKIFEEFDKWNIYVTRKNGEITGAIYYIDEKLMLEIFGVNFLNGQFDENIFRSLMVKCLNEGKKSGSGFIDFFSEEKEHPVLLELGFKSVGEYRCYKRKLCD